MPALRLRLSCGLRDVSLRVRREGTCEPEEQLGAELRSRWKYAEGARQVDLARDYGLHQTTVSKILLHDTHRTEDSPRSAPSRLWRRSAKDGDY